MKVFNRASLPSKIVYNGKNYFYDSTFTRLHKEHKVFNKKHCILVKVLSRRLKGKTDLHGKEYQPSEWVFNCYSPSNFHLPQFEKIIQNNLSKNQNQLTIKI